MLEQKTTTSNRGHHPSSPSSLQASEACSAFLNEQRESEAATEGTLLHSATENRDLSILGGEEELIAAASKAIEYEDAVLGEFRLSGERVEVIRETYLHVGDEKVTDEAGNVWLGITGGYPDVLVVGQRRGAVLDWKFGKVPVTPARSNLQGIAYVLGAFQAFPHLEEIEIHFFAPRQGWSLEEQKRTYVHLFHRREIPTLELGLRTVVAKKKKATEQLSANNWESARPKNDLCLWCARKADCPKISAIIQTGVSKYYDLVVPEEVKDYRLDTPERVASAQKFASQLKTICESVLKRCTDAAVTEGLLPPGYSLVKSSRREVTSVRRFVELSIDAGLTENEAVELLNVPITSFETALKEKAAKGSGAAKVRAFAAELAENGVTKEGRPFYFLRQARNPAEQSSGILTIT